MKNIKLNTKTTFGFSVKLNMAGKSATEKLDCIKKIEEIINENNGAVTKFESLPYSRGGKYARHTSTLSNVLTFELINNHLSVNYSSKSANHPTFSVEVYSDLFLQKKEAELLLKIDAANCEYNSFSKGIGFNFIRKKENERILAEKKAEEMRIAAEKMRINAERIRTERIEAGENFIEKSEDFFNIINIDSDFMAQRDEFSRYFGYDKSKLQKEFFGNFLKNNKIVIEDEKLFWKIFQETKYADKQNRDI